MLSAILLMTLVLSVSVGNLALGYGLALQLGHGPADGWQALCFWKRNATVAVAHTEQDKPEAAAPAPAHGGGH